MTTRWTTIMHVLLIIFEHVHRYFATTICIAAINVYCSLYGMRVQLITWYMIIICTTEQMLYSRCIHDAFNVSPHTVYPKKYAHGFCFALLCCVVVIHWLIFPYPSGLLHWHCGNLTFAPVPAKQPWWIWRNISCKFIIKDCITTT